MFSLYGLNLPKDFYVVVDDNVIRMSLVYSFHYLSILSISSNIKRLFELRSEHSHIFLDRCFGLNEESCHWGKHIWEQVGFEDL